MSYLTLFIASLLGSPHCAGMCGGFALFCSPDSRSFGSTIAYNLGRLVTYLTLGALAGALGSSVELELAQVGLKNWLGILVGALLVLWGGARLFGRGIEVTSAKDSLPMRIYRLGLNSIIKLPPLPRAGLVGVFSTLLPCGWLYAFVALAALAGSAWQGSLTLCLFWLGTLPMMLFIGQASRLLLKRWGAQIPGLTAALLIASGIFCVLTHLDVVSLMPGHSHGAHSH